MTMMSKLESGLPKTDPSDYSVYTGSSGVALLYLLLFHQTNNADLLQKSHSILKQSVRHLKNRRVSFLTGDSGPLALLAVVNRALGQSQESAGLVDRVKALSRVVTTPDPDMSDEVLYGRAGYLFTLLFLNRHLGPSTVEPDIIRQVVGAVLKSGRERSEKDQISRECPLSYQWHDTNYQGAAHGVAGILYILLLCREHLSQRDLNELIRPTLDHLLKQRYPSHNLPSSAGSNSDRLVQWCHGAPGLVHLAALASQMWGLHNTQSMLPQDCLQAIKLYKPSDGAVDFPLYTLSHPYQSTFAQKHNNSTQWNDISCRPVSIKVLSTSLAARPHCHIPIIKIEHNVYGEQKYVRAALECGDVVWERGLLTKGYSICHGVAGNAYTFLTLYHLDRDVRHLYRAGCFADWCTMHPSHEGYKPDRPMSLFEGISGVIYFLSDILNPKKASFPAFGF